jgi:hypothetical protein
MSVLPVQAPELQRRVAWPSHMLWLGAHITAFLMAIPFYWLALAMIGQRQVPTALFFAFIACSLMLGILQGLIIHNHLTGMSWWLWGVVTALTISLTGAFSIWLADILTQQGYRPIMGYYEYMPLGGAIIGAGLGLTQWMLLKSRVTGPRTWVWLPTLLFVGALVSSLLLWPILDNIMPLYGYGPVGWVVKLTLCGLCAGGLSGITLWSLIRRHNIA